MPSPIAHSFAAYLIWRIGCCGAGTKSRSDLVPFLAIVALSLLPDIDAVPGMASGDFGRYHNNISHSICAGLVAAPLAGLVARIAGVGFRRWTIIGLVAYELHVLMDYLTVGRGAMLLWPLTSERFQPPVTLFRGVQWAAGWRCSGHLATIANEVLVAGIVLGICLALRRCLCRATGARSGESGSDEPNIRGCED